MPGAARAKEAPLGVLAPLWSNAYGHYLTDVAADASADDPLAREMILAEKW